MSFLIENSVFSFDDIISETCNFKKNIVNINKFTNVCIKNGNIINKSFGVIVEDNLQDLWFSSPFGTFEIEQINFESINEKQYLVEAVFFNGSKKKSICLVDKLELELSF